MGTRSFVIELIELIERGIDVVTGPVVFWAIPFFLALGSRLHRRLGRWKQG